jgi:NADPH:quinone reductase-like Zn-dependent oxidoreductase
MTLTMRAVVQHRYGGPETLEVEEVSRPTVGSDQVLVRVRAVSLNPTDYVVMRGLLRPLTGWRRPRQQVQGLDVAGIVEAVGADVAELAPGEAVYGVCRGAFAEYAVGVPRNLVPKPERLSFEQAAGMAVAGTMALQALRDHAELRAGQRIAITGATGGVGSFAVQIAKAYGAHVTAVCRTENVELARQLGADRVFDYTRDDYLREQRYDAIFDNGGGRSLRELRRAVVPDGVVVLNCGQDVSLIVAGYVARLVLRRRGVKQFVREVTQARLLELAALVEDSSVTPVVDRTYRLAETPAAMRYLMARHPRGKVVVTP